MKLISLVVFFLLSAAVLLLLPVDTARAVTDCTNQSDISQAECEALIAFYNSTNGPNWTNRDGWADTNTPCSWFGVDCSGSSVKGIGLPSNGLVGAIPADIGGLTNLTGLTLTGNFLTTLPPEFGNLSNLGTLRIDANRFASLPDEIGGLTRLEVLTLNDNLLTALPNGIGNLSSLERISLINNALTGLPSTIGNLSNLEGLDVRNNQLASLPPEIGNLTKLTGLNLINNALTTLPPEIGNLTSLETLRVNENQLVSLPPEIGNLNIFSLYLENNQLTTLPAEIGNLSALVTLVLDNNQLESLPLQIGNFANLSSLSLMGNRLTNLPPTIRNLDLQSFNVNYNMLVIADGATLAYLNENAPGWETTQTVLPSNIRVVAPTNSDPATTMQVEWDVDFALATDILQSGYYEVGYTPVENEPYIIAGRTTDKSVAGLLVTDLAPGTTYYFAVRAFTPALPGANNNALTTEWSPVISATTDGEPTPEPTEEPTAEPTDEPTAEPTDDPTPVEPTDWIAPVGAINTIGNPIYQWAAVDGATGYEIYVGANNATYSPAVFYGVVPSFVCVQGICSIDLTTQTSLIPNAIGWITAPGGYSVFINPNPGNLGTWQGPYNFTVNTPRPTVPTVTSVGDTITWTLEGDAAYAAFFQLYLAPQNAITSPIVSTWVLRDDVCGNWDATTCSYTVPGGVNQNTTYGLYMQSFGAGGFSTGGNIAGVDGWLECNFDPADGVCAPLPTEPTDLTVTPDENGITLSWTASENADFYNVWVGTLIRQAYFETLSAAELGCDVERTCTVTLPGTLMPQTYSWYVRAVGVGGVPDNNLLGWVIGPEFTVFGGG